MADSKSIVVLNLGSQRLSGAVFGKSGGDLILKRYEFVDMSGDPTVDASRIPQLKIGVQELANRLRVKGSAVWYAVAGHAVFSRFVKLPPVQQDRVQQIVEFEARQNVPFPINEVIWDYEFVVPPGSGEVEVVLVAMKADALNEINEQVASSGLKTAGVDLAPLAVYNAFRYSYPDVDETAVVIDLGARSTNLIFVEDGKFFVRNILVGGATITNAVAKEFQVGFGDAEQQKVSNGFISQGGAVEDHPDPSIAGLSKVIRQAATRIHGEIMRTINYYRTQQGGGQPRRVFICGGGALLANMSEFLEEKLKMPVEILNPLRGVQLDRGVNADSAAADAPFMAELVGLALRGAGAAPSEIELVPDAIATSRDAARRAPALVLAGLCAMAALGAGIMYFKNAERVVDQELVEMNAEQRQLNNYASQIRALDGALAQAYGKSKQLEQAVLDRSYWVRLLTELNSKFTNDLIWLTQVHALKNGRPMTPQLVTDANAAPAPSGEGTPSAGGETVYELEMDGLWRFDPAQNPEGEQVVYQYAAALAASPFFGVTDFEQKRADYVSAESGVEGDRYAYKFKIKLPLKQPMQFQQ
jgi:type IV pilus assembly protein PilM